MKEIAGNENDFIDYFRKLIFEQTMSRQDFTTHTANASDKEIILNTLEWKNVLYRSVQREGRFRMALKILA